MARFPDGLKLTWLGHATYLIDAPNGKRVLIDPWVMNNPACPDEFKSIDSLDAMLITHAHFDHIGDAVEIAKATNPEIVCQPELAAWLGSKGVSEDTLIGMNLGGTVEVAGLQVHMTPAVHSCGITDGDQTLYGGVAAGYVVEFPDGFKLYHAGDTAVFGDMALIGKLLRPDAAILPIGDHFTMGPTSAAEAVRLLGVKTVIPCHFGTFPVLTGRPEDLRKEAADVAGLEVLDIDPGDSLP